MSPATKESPKKRPWPPYPDMVVERWWRRQVANQNTGPLRDVRIHLADSYQKQTFIEVTHWSHSIF